MHDSEFSATPYAKSLLAYRPGRHSSLAGVIDIAAMRCSAASIAPLSHISVRSHAASSGPLDSTRAQLVV